MIPHFQRFDSALNGPSLNLRFRKFVTSGIVPLLTLSPTASRDSLTWVKHGEPRIQAVSHWVHCEGATEKVSNSGAVTP